MKPPGKPSNRLLVIAPAQFHDELHAFIVHKKKLLDPELVSLEAILKQCEGFDDPEKLKRYLFEQWRGIGLGYVLLVGDVDVLPVRFMVLDRVTPAAFDYAFYPSDLYYADLVKSDGRFEDWNARKDGFHGGYFGEVRGEKNKQDPINYDEIDYLPEIAVGRWPVSTAAAVRMVVAKTIRYENTLLGGSAPEPMRAGFVAVGGWVDSRPLLNQLAAALTDGWSVEKRFYSSRGNAYNTRPPDHDQLRFLFNQGLRLLVHTGHGQPDAWEQCFSMRDLDSLANAASLPVVISAGCSTAYFAPLPPYGAYVDVDGKEHAGTDHKEKFQAPPPPPSPYQRGKFNPSGLGDQMLQRNPNGAVAYIGCNTGSQPCALTLVKGFVLAIAEGNGSQPGRPRETALPAHEPRLGDCWARALRFYFHEEDLSNLKPNDDWYPPSIFFQGMKFMLFGDPSLPIFNQKQ